MFSIGLCFLIFSVIVIQIRSRNDEIAPNELGKVAKVCASSLCPQFNSLDLWMEIKPVCYTDTSVKKLSDIIKEQEAYLQAESEWNNSYRFTAHQVGLLAAFASVLGLILGFYVGEIDSKQESVSKFSYTSIPTAEVDSVLKK